VGDAAPQPTQLVGVHVVVGAGSPGVGELGPEEVADPLFHLLEADVGLQRLLLQQHGQQQGHVLESSTFVIAVLVEDEGSPRWQQLEAVYHCSTVPSLES